MEPSALAINDYKYTPTVQNIATVPNPPNMLATIATRSSVTGTDCFGRLSKEIRVSDCGRRLGPSRNIRGKVESKPKGGQ